MNDTSTLPRRTALAIGAFAIFSAALPYLPGPRRFAGLGLDEFKLALAIPLPKAAEIREIKPEPATIAKPAPLEPLATPNLTFAPGSLQTFFAALERTGNKEPGAVTRILHYGDSPTTADSITSDVRRLLQGRFGDAGHGFLLIAKPWAWYGHAGMKLDGEGWQIEPASQARAVDGFHGLGGVSFRGQAGATSTVGLTEDHTRVIVYYVAQPGGGDFALRSGEVQLGEVHTAADEKKPAFAEFPLGPGQRNIELRVTSGSVRLFGYRFDRGNSGVQYSSLGVNGAQVQMALRSFEVGQWTAALQHEDPDLVVLNYGTNESIYPEYIAKQYPEELRKVILRIRQAVPRASVLVMSPMDRGVLEGGEIVTPPALLQLIDVQKRIAAETGCAFFNTFEAMGGAGTMGRWYHMQPRLVSADFIHPLPQGAAKVGTLFEQALLQAYESASR